MADRRPGAPPRPAAVSSLRQPPPTDRRETMMRIRSDSTGSTRGAFVAKKKPEAEIDPPPPQEEEMVTPTQSQGKRSKYKGKSPRQKVHKKDGSTASVELSSDLIGDDLLNGSSDQYLAEMEKGGLLNGNANTYNSGGYKQYQSTSVMSNPDVNAFSRNALAGSYNDGAVGYKAEDGVDRYDIDDAEEGGWIPYMTQCAKDGIRELLKNLFYDAENPEFTSLQQFIWAIVIGVFFGILTAKWGEFIETCVDFVWKELPETLLEMGVFTELDGRFPLPYYMIICPAVFGGILSYVSVILPTPIPGQNEWIEGLHIFGILDHSTFIPLIVISTMGMASGLSLGPELPLVLASGMVGSFLGSTFHQSILSARVMNLTAGAAAIGGFFGFPMAGALFVMEIPHRMGLQYFEALSPATIASIVSVLVNRMVTGNDIKGYFNYPFMSSTLPSHIFYAAILYGLVGSFIGVCYADGCKKLKTWVHDWFHHHDHHDDHGHGHGEMELADAAHGHGHTTETIPLVGSKVHMYKDKPKSLMDRLMGCCKMNPTIKHEPTRCAIVGVIAGAVTGTICMFLPHNLFWGEAQLQTLIDQGRTPLPVFGIGDEPTADLTAYGYCMIDHTSEEALAAGFNLRCSFILTVTKIIVIGLSLGTGIVGGHFWGPLYVGAIGAQFFNDAIKYLASQYGFNLHLADFPCVSLLCIMGSTHVVTFRAHMAIMLILTLTISAFIPEDNMGGFVGGDYSAVFPLLVVSCFVSLMVTRSTVFYNKQRCRGDIIASPQVLCEPKKEGMPEYPMHQAADEYDYDDGSMYDSTDDESVASISDKLGSKSHDDDAYGVVVTNVNTTADDIEREFNDRIARDNNVVTVDPLTQALAQIDDLNNSDPMLSDTAPSTPSPLISSTSKSAIPSSAINEILNDKSIMSPPTKSFTKRSHRRVHSGSELVAQRPSNPSNTIARPDKIRNRATSYDARGRRPSLEKSPSIRDRSHSRDQSVGSQHSGSVLMRVPSYGQITEYQPPLMSQGRTRSSSVNKKSGLPLPGKTHKRKPSGGGRGGGIPVDVVMEQETGAISAESIERAFSSMQNQAQLDLDGSGYSLPEPPTRRGMGSREGSFRK